MTTYLVGGAVRDALLGLPVNERDWVVVGTTPAALLAAGYRRVGRDFPVFLHPTTGEEYALARTERKTAPGYAGFTFHAAADVTLEADLRRRDLTVNAMAQDEHGRLIDPHDGRRDLEARVLRHVSPAFAEDPVRILRLARFAARFPDFAVADETLALARHMVAAGEVDALVAERVWQELARGLMTARPSRMFEVLRLCGALVRLLPEVDRLWHCGEQVGQTSRPDAGGPAMRVLDIAAQLDAPLEVRFACLGLGLAAEPWQASCTAGPREAGAAQRGVAPTRAIGERLKVPAACRELADVVIREQASVDACLALDAAGLLGLLERCDALRRPARLADVLLACECQARGAGMPDRTPGVPAAAPSRPGTKTIGEPPGDDTTTTAYPQRRRLQQALIAAQCVDGARIAAGAAARGLRGPAIGAALRVARVEAIERRLAAPDHADADANADVTTAAPATSPPD